MKKKNRCLALALSAVLALSATACGNGFKENETKNNVNTTVDPLAAAQENVDKITSLDAKMVTDMEVSFSMAEESQAAHMITTMDMSCFYNPLRLKAEITVDAIDSADAANSESVTMGIYADTDESGTCTMYINYDSDWFSQPVGKSDLETYDAINDIQAYLDGNSAFKEAGMELVNGANAYKYTGVLSKDATNELLLSIAADSLSSYGFDPSMMDNTGDLGGVTIILWIDEATLYPVKYEIDMTEAMNTLMENLMKNLVESIMTSMGVAESELPEISMSVPKAVITMTYYNFNTATEFSIPAEAKSN